MSIEIRIVCDECKVVDDTYGHGYTYSGAKPHLLRKNLETLRLWRRQDGGRDLCHHCAMRSALKKEEHG